MFDREVPVDRPPVDAAGGEHGRVLAGAVLLKRRGRDALRSEHCAGRGAIRPRHSVSKVVFSQVRRSEQRTHRGEVARFTAVTRAGHRQLLSGDLQTGRDHRIGLHRLQARPGIDNEVGITDLGFDDTVGVEHDTRSTVERFFEGTPRRNSNRSERLASEPRLFESGHGVLGDSA